MIATGSDLLWYARPEPGGPWRISACSLHGELLASHRFNPVGRMVDTPHLGARVAEQCQLCRSPELLGQIAHCTCEYDTARCPEHQNLGCSC